VVGAVPICYASILLRGNWAREYIPARLSTSNKGWHLQWFSLKNIVAATMPRHALPKFSLDTIESPLDCGRNGASWGRTRTKFKTTSPSS
jgi:hypothetical protein